MNFFFYILFSESLDKYYLGYTSNLTKRLKKHNEKHKGFTGKANDWKMVYTERFESKNKAYERERQVKSWKNRKLIEQLVKKSSEHPDFTSGGS